jgi:hypothetical protein
MAFKIAIMFLGVSIIEGNLEQKYHMWKDYSDRDNECITEWNARVRHVHEREICSKAVTTSKECQKIFGSS